MPPMVASMAPASCSVLLAVFAFMLSHVSPTLCHCGLLVGSISSPALGYPLREKPQSSELWQLPVPSVTVIPGT